MDDSEVFVFVLSFVAAGIGVVVNRTGALHGLYFRGNPGPGLVRLGVLLAMVWIAFVIWRHADPSVTGVYVWFYLVMGYAAVKLLGQTTPAAFGARMRVDVGERRNLAAALLVAAFTLATGMIFGGSLWGEADPTGEGEGGWWIPVTFFLLGWATLLVAFRFFLSREAGHLKTIIQRERDLVDARAAAFFLVSCAVPLTDAVAGDFWGWSHAFLTFGVIAGMLLVREAAAARRTVESPRLLESLAYLVLGGGAWWANRVLDQMFGAG
ncbi:MAG: hypothetical protein A2W29_05760 [Gemmatimonadetes bacterium RBG_16_66_8]|nr:MAG: hypothetical protein A2W29_05760 [Gemmatimonadetes bacterium RBG_16_66_8]